jgi:hypothetical protein
MAERRAREAPLDLFVWASDLSENRCALFGPMLYDVGIFDDDAA